MTAPGTTFDEPAGGDPTPDDLTALHQRIWTERGERAGVRIVVPPCPYTASELTELERAGRSVGYVPPEVADRASRHLLGTMFPLMDCYSLHPDNEVENLVSRPGWFDYEAAIDAPRLGTDEAELLAMVAAEGRELISMNQYVVATQDSRLRTGRYLDERRTWARIGIRVIGRIVSVRCDGDDPAEGMGDEPPVPGSLLTGYDLHPDFAAPFAGGRTFGVARSERDVRPEPEPQAPVRGIHPAQRGEPDAAAQWRRQADRLVAAGLPAELGLSVPDYLASLPRFGTQPPRYRDRFDAPVIVETRVPWERLYALLGIRISPFMAHFPQPVPTGPDSTHRTAPYTAWFTRWGARFPDPVAPGDARAALQSDEVGANLLEGGAVVHAVPELVESARFFDLIGYVFPATAVGGEVHFDPIERTPGICRWRGRPEFACNLHPLAFSVFRPLVRGRETSA